MLLPQVSGNFSTFSVCSYQSINKMAANDGQIKLTIIHDLQMIFHCEYWKFNKNFFDVIGLNMSLILFGLR